MEEDLNLAGLDLNGKIDGIHQMTLEDIAKDRNLERCHGAVDSWTQLED